MAQTALGSGARLAIDSSSFFLRRWGDPAAPPVLMIHGWLDNSASFAALGPKLAGAHAVAFDCAGHGQSAPNPGAAPYSLWRDVADVFRIADCLGWPRFHLLGHSRGAMMAFLAAGTLPERVLSLHLIEGLYPQLSDDRHAPRRLRRSFEEIEALRVRPRRYYKTFEQALRSRMRGHFPLTFEAAGMLAEHGVDHGPEGYFWRYDPKLMATSEVGFNAQQIEAFAAQQRCPRRVYLGEAGLYAADQQAQAWLEQHPDFEVYRFVGNHHFHMHTGVEDLAARILNTITKKPLS